MLKKIFKIWKVKKTRGFSQNPFFYFGLTAFVLFGLIYFSCGGSANVSGLSNSRVVFFNSFFDQNHNVVEDCLFAGQTDAAPLETPDLKIVQGNTLYGVATPSIVSGKVLGDIFGGSNLNKKEIIEYAVQPGDTLQSIAANHKVSVNTLLWANGLTSSSALKVGQSITILPVDGVLHIVRSGDTLSAIAQKYKSDSQDVIAYNDLANQDDIYIGDILVVPGGVLPPKSPSSSGLNIAQVPLADNFFIFPVQGKISQGLHYYNAVDVSNKCGTLVYAAAAGVVQRVVANGGYNAGMGNHMTILHSNGIVTYYGHLMSVSVKPGDKVYTGQNIALMGGAPGMAGAGRSTGCHLHFQVVGAKNPLSVYAVGASISYK